MGSYYAGASDSAHHDGGGKYVEHGAGRHDNMSDACWLRPSDRH
ncbi:MAG TPA: hypothetical protein VFH56_01410 [Acidimicrobiales bacterium]|nr:hypothetical protein [Acidimicrobiales bacterium]